MRKLMVAGAVSALALVPATAAFADEGGDEFTDICTKQGLVVDYVESVRQDQVVCVSDGKSATPPKKVVKPKPKAKPQAVSTRKQPTAPKVATLPRTGPADLELAVGGLALVIAGVGLVWWAKP